MKKFVTRALAIAMTLGMLFALTACAGQPTAEDMIKKSNAALENAKSVDMDMTIDMSISMMEQTETITTVMSMTTFMDPMKMKMVMNLGEGADAMNMEIYAEESGESMTMYAGMNGEWTVQTLSGADYEAATGAYNAKESLELYLGSSEGFSIAGNEKIGSADAVKLAGVITKDELSSVMNQAGGFEDLVAQSGGALTQADVDEVIASLQDLPVAFWVDAKTYVPLRYEMDMTAAMDGMYRALSAAMGLGEDAMGTEKMFIRIDIKGIDTVADFEIPEAARAAAQ